MSPLLLVVSVVSAAGPKDNDVVAGWGAFWIFVGGVVAVVLLGRSLVVQLRRAQAAKDAGVYGDEPAGTEAPPGGAGETEDADRPS